MTDASFLYSPLAFEHPRRLGPSGWLEHIPFAFWLIDVLRPRMLVELGTHTGISYCAFCQAARAVGPAGRFYAVDTWQGDEHAGRYTSDVFVNLSNYHKPLYGDFSTLVRSTFDEALDTFEDGMIDLLHIDGLHTYEAVRHDFETWAPKLSERAVVLFHDTNVRTEGFGVFKYWAEIADQYPSFEFVHGNGLGVLAVGSEQTEPMRRLTDGDEGTMAAARRTFAHLGETQAFRLALAQRHAKATQKATAS